MATQPAIATEQIFYIPLADITPSRYNPRRHVDEQSLSDFADDIASRGVQEPVLLRPLQNGKRKYEIVFGERRYLASERAKKETIPSIVREMSDEEAQELRVTENLQREDLHPLEWAAALQWFYKKRLKETRRHDEALTFVSAKFHRPAETVARLLKLNDLLDEAKQAFREGKMLPEHAFEIARLRREEQKQVLDWLLSQQTDIRTEAGWKKQYVMPGAAELKLWIRQNLFLDLGKAPFDTADRKLNPKMGACTDCQFRTGSQPALFGDVKAGDTCTVPECWATKRNNSLVQIANARAKELGVKSVLKVGLGYASWNKSKVPVDIYIEYNSGARIVKKGNECKNTQPGIITWMEQSADNKALKVGDAVLVCPKATECPTHKNVDSRAERKRKTYEEMAGTRITNLRQDTPQRLRAALIAAVVQSAVKREAGLSRKHPLKFQLMADQMHSDLFFDRHRDLCKLLGVQPDLDRYKNKDWRGTSAKIFEKNPVALMVAMTVMHQYHAGSYTRQGGDPLPQFLRLYRVDAKGIEKRVKTDVAEKIATIQQSLDKRKAKQTKPAK